jgi:hypothetical protein
MDFGLFRRLAEETARKALAPALAYHVMGEPLLYPRLPEALRLTRELGLRAVLTTNGSLLTPERAAAAAEARPHFVAVSLQTPDPESFRLRGREGSAYEGFRDRILEGVRTLLVHSPETKVSLFLLTTPLKWALFPATRGLTILDTSRVLRQRVRTWVSDLAGALEGSHPFLPAAELEKGIGRLRVWRQNRLDLSARLGIETRIAGDWGRRARQDGGRAAYPARRGTCHGLREHVAVLWDGTYAYCCTDYEGRTSRRNASETGIEGFLGLPEVQRDRQGFEDWQLHNPACRQCLGGPTRFHRWVRQTGSILYLSVYRRWFQDPLRYREA